MNMKKMVMVLGLLMVFLMVGCTDNDQRVYGNRIGAYTLEYKLGDGTPIYKLITPRGAEFVRGSENLQWSLDTYRENGTYGKDYRDI